MAKVRGIISMGEEMEERGGGGRFLGGVYGFKMGL